MKFSTTNWWPIACLDCGVNADLMTDKYTRIICRECHQKNEFNKVETAESDFPRVEKSKDKCPQTRRALWYVLKSETEKIVCSGKKEAMEKLAEVFSE